MKTDFSNWFNFDLKKAAPFDKHKEVTKIVDEKLAADVQRSLRTRIDPGLDRKAGAAGEAVKVEADDGRLVIRTESHAEVLKATSQMMSGSKNKGLEAGSVEDLFKPSSGVPEMEKGADGKSKLVYRRIQLEKIFTEQKKKAQDDMVRQTVENTVSTELGRTYEEAFKEVANKNPED